MAVSLVATPEPTHVPPRVRLDLDTGSDSSLLTDVTITRNGEKVRAQPYAGGRLATAYDYEAPFGRPVDYRAKGSAATFATLYSTGAWPNTSGWTVTGTVSTSDNPGYLSAAGSATLNRTLPTNARRVVISPNMAGSALWRLRVGPVLATVNPTNGQLIAFLAGGSSVTVPWTSGSADLSWTDSVLTITTPQGRGTANAGSSPSIGSFELSLFSGSVVPRFDVMGPTTTSFTVAAATNLAVSEAWLIHPVQPSKSISIDPGVGRWRENGLNVDRATAQERQRAAKRTLHEPYGRKRAVPIITGPRMAASWTLVLHARTLEQRDSVDDITDDQAPLLLRSPAGWRWDLPDGWYSVDDITEARPREALIFADRKITLPLTPVDAPLSAAGSLRTFADVLIENDTYADVLATYETFLDLLTGDAS